MEGPLSRDPLDHTPKTRALIAAIAKNFFDGDEARAWQAFFAADERRVRRDRRELERNTTSEVILRSSSQ